MKTARVTGPLALPSRSYSIVAENKQDWKAKPVACTILVDLTGNLVAAQELLCHKSLTTTAMHYKKRTENALPTGMKLLEAASGKNGG